MTLNQMNKYYWSFLIITVFLLPYNVFAQNRTSNPAQALRNVSVALTEIENINTKVEEIGKNIVSLNGDVTRYQGEIDRLCGGSEADCRRLNTRAQRERLDRLQRRRNLAEEEIEAAERDIENQNVGLARLKERSTPEYIETQLRSLDVRTKILGARGELQDVEGILDEIEDVYDQSVMGAYLQNKITKLLTAQPPNNLICRASSNCGDGSSSSPRAIDARDVGRYLFNQGGGASPSRRASGRPSPGRAEAATGTGP